MALRVFLVFFLLVGLVPSVTARSRKLWVISGLSGIAAKWNRYQNTGIELAREELNAAGWRIELVYEDAGSSSPKAISAFDKLLAVDKVQAILANDFGFVIAPLLARTAERKLFFTALSLPHDRYCEEGGGYFFSATS